MAVPRMNLIVLRSDAPERTVAFYERLGMRFQQEQHGTGPVHWAAELGGLVFEVYPARSATEVDSKMRLGFEVADVLGVLHALRASGAEIIHEQKVAADRMRFVVRDPDGRSVDVAQAVPAGEA